MDDSDNVDGVLSDVVEQRVGEAADLGAPKSLVNPRGTLGENFEEPCLVTQG